MKLRTKIILAQAPIGGVLALVGLIAIWTVATLSRESGQVLSQSYRSVLTLQRLTEAVERVDGAALLMIAGEREMGKIQARVFSTVVDGTLADRAGYGEGQSDQALIQLWRSFEAGFDALTRIDEPEAARRHYFGAIEPVVAEIRRTAGQLLALNQDELLRRNDEIERISARVTAIMVTIAIAAFAIGTWLSIVLTGRTLRPLRALGEAARRIGAGDLSARAEARGRDEIGKLAQDFNQMAKRIEDYRKSSLGELLQAQLALLSAIDSLPDPILVLGVEGRVTTVNAAAIQILGVPASPVGQDALAAVDPLIASTVVDLAQHVLAGKGPVAAKGISEALAIRRGPETHWLLPRATPVYEAGAGVVGATVVFQDVTRLRQYDELKNDMMATVAHEFRAPLTSLRMAIHLCLEEVVGPLTEKQADLLHAAREECERLETMVDDLLDLSRLEAGRMTLSIAPSPLTEALDPAVDAAAALAAVRGVTVTVDLPPILDDAMMDQERLTNVFRNLIDNAIRFTPVGGTVRVTAKPVGDRLKVLVTDAGPGIEPKYQPRVFDKFFRIPGAPPGGAGLGLSIAREIVLAHGGEIGVESTIGQGATFWFTVPAVSLEAPGPVRAEPEDTE